MYKAAIDLGTNSLRALVAKLNSDKSLDIVFEKAYLCRMGEKLNETKNIQAISMARAIEALQDIRSHFDILGVSDYNFVATSALRDAINAQEFTDKVNGLGLNMQIISGQEEAKIIAKAVNFFLPGISDNSVFIDQGGGSIEFVHHFGAESRATETVQSLDIGVVRLYEKFFHNNPPISSEILSFNNYFKQALTSHVSTIAEKKPDQAIIIGGTGATLAKLMLGLESFDSNLIHGSEVSLEFAQSFAAVIQNLSALQVKEKYNLESKRADIILAGTLQIIELLNFFQLHSFVVSDRGLRYGLLL